MNLLTLIVGMPSTGKTTSLQKLGADTVVYNTEKKMLPFRNVNGIKVSATSSTDDLIVKLKKLAEPGKFDNIKNIVIDSFSDYTDMLMAECRVKYKGFDVYNNLNSKIYELFQVLKSIENKYIFLTGHPETLQDADGNVIYRMSVRGKEWEGKVEKVATCVFYSDPQRKTDGTKGVNYRFMTNTDGRYPAKTPFGMFPDMYIENDLAKIIATYDEFYKEEIAASKADAAKVLAKQAA